ncbi:MAG: hypothetical protein SGI96_21270 [Bacteroidota bacterium]|nr:hypothetical protein [Bacteroidota bacterium]
MAQITPPIFTYIHDEETNYKISKSEELARKIIHDTNYMSGVLPLGQIMTANINQVGAIPINLNVWQLCDGSEIVNPASPLRSIGVNIRFTPNMPDTFMRGANTVTGNPTGGSQNFNLAHDHSGGTQGDDPSGLTAYQDDGDPGARRYRESHGHGLGPPAIGNIVIDFPKWFKVAPYMKIQ